jgi:hypothetical protein
MPLLLLLLQPAEDGAHLGALHRQDPQDAQPAQEHVRRCGSIPLHALRRPPVCACCVPRPGCMQILPLPAGAPASGLASHHLHVFGCMRTSNIVHWLHTCVLLRLVGGGKAQGVSIILHTSLSLRGLL